MFFCVLNLFLCVFLPELLCVFCVLMVIFWCCFLLKKKNVFMFVPELDFGFHVFFGGNLLSCLVFLASSH